MSSQDSYAPSQSQSLSQGKRRRRSAPPPSRLSWPGSLSQTQSTSLSQPSTLTQHWKKKKTSRSKSSSSTSRSGNKNKRQRTLLDAFNTSGNNDDDDHSSSLLWVDQYAPTCRKELCVAPKKVQEVADWMLEGRENLLILVGRPGIGKSALVRVLAEELHTELLEWNDSISTWSQHVESKSPIDSFQEFLQQGGVGFASLEFQLRDSSRSSSHTASSVFHKRLILLEELPNRANAEAQQRFRRILTNHVQNSNIKTVWIYSDGTEGQSKPQDLERCIEPSVLYQHSKILQINPATKSQIKKALERIAKAERFSVKKEFCERMHLQSGGDVRYAIMSLQFDQAARGTRSGDEPEHARDTQWTAFHALGKILYAKREPIEDTNHSIDPDERPPLAFDPEQVLEHCDLDLGHALTYLGYHSADFFTDIEELSTAFDLFSDSSYLLEQTTNYSYQRRRYNNTNTTVACPIFPEGYVTSLTGRSMAYANRHPTPSKFRQLNAPKILEIRRKRTENSHHLTQLQHRLSRLSLAADPLGSKATGSNSLPSFVMDRLPFLRVIAQDSVAASLDLLHTSASLESNTELTDPDDIAAAAAKLEEEQEEILQMDDIEDYDSAEEDEKMSTEEKDSNLQTQQQPQLTSQAQTQPASHPPPTSQLLPQSEPESKPQVASQPQLQPVVCRNIVSSSSSDARENNENRLQGSQERPMKPIKRIANPYARAKKVAKQSNPNSNLAQQPVRVKAEPVVSWSRPLQPAQPFVKSEPDITTSLPPPRASNPLPQAPVPDEAKSSSTRNDSVLMDV